MLLPPIPHAQVVRFDEATAARLADALDQAADELHRAATLHRYFMGEARQNWRGTTARWVGPQADHLHLALDAAAQRCRDRAVAARRGVDVASALQARYNQEQGQRDAVAAARAQAQAPNP